MIIGLVLLGKSTPETHGFFHVFSIKFDGLSGVNFPIIQFFEIDRPTRF